MTRLVRITILSLFFFTASSKAAIITYNAESKISGIEDIFINTNWGGDVFDIKFIDGSCEGLLSRCSQDSAAFNYGATVFWPSVAIRTVLGNLLDSPELIEGCESTTLCKIIFPEQTFCCDYSVAGEFLNVMEGPNNDMAFSTSNLGILRSTDTSLDISATLALVTLADDSSQMPTVSSPASAMLLSLALVFMFFGRKKSRYSKSHHPSSEFFC